MARSKQSSGRTWALLGLCLDSQLCCLCLPCPSAAWPRRCPLSNGEQGGVRPGWLGQCHSPPTLTGAGVCNCVYQCVSHTHGALCCSFSFSQLAAPAGRKQSTWPRAYGRRRQVVPLGPGAGGERFWGCSVSCDLSQEHRDLPSIWAIRSRVFSLKVYHR